MMHYPRLPIVLARPRLPGHRGVEASQNCSAGCPSFSFIPQHSLSGAPMLASNISPYLIDTLIYEQKAKHGIVEIGRSNGPSIWRFGRSRIVLGSRIVTPHV